MFQRQTSGYVKSASSELFLAFSSTELKAQASFSDYFCPVSVCPQTFFYTLPTSTPEPLDRIQPNLHKTSLGNAVRVCENDWPRPLVLKICLYFSKFFSKKKTIWSEKQKLLRKHPQILVVQTQVCQNHIFSEGGEGWGF